MWRKDSLTIVSRSATGAATRSHTALLELARKKVMTKSRNKSGRNQNQGQNRNQGQQQRQQTQGRQQTRTQTSGRQENWGTQSQLPFGPQGQQNNRSNQNHNQNQSFAGYGPKGWQRNDDSIRNDIYEHLTAHHQIDARDIEVNVRGGEVTLTGSVPDRFMKLNTEYLVHHLNGVVEIHNQLRMSGQPFQGQNRGQSPDLSYTGRNGRSGGLVQERSPS